MSLIIGLVGEKGSGKGTFIEFLKECAKDKTIVRLGSSEILGKTLDLWDIPRTRRNLQDIAIVIENHFGHGTLTNAIKKMIMMHIGSTDIIFYDGIRWQDQADMIRSFPNYLLIYITANVNVRYKRTKARKEKTDEATASFEQFLAEEKVATETDIPMIGKSADITIDTSSFTMPHYKTVIEKIYREKISKIY